MHERWLVVGGGVGGIAGAWLLARAGHGVTLVEAGEELGRASRSIRWNGFELDFGCHLFGNDSPETTRILLNLLEGNAYAVHGQPASITRGRLSENSELPDVSGCGAAGVEALQRAAGQPGNEEAAGDLAGWLAARYGAPVGSALAARTSKMWRIEADALGAEARHAGPFRRARVTGDEHARQLKRDAALDDRIAARPADDTSEDAARSGEGITTRSLYPAAGSMGGFARAARRVLEKSGVTLQLGRAPQRLEPRASSARLTLADGETVAADRILWTNGLADLESCIYGTRELAGATHRVPMTLFWFVVPAEAQGPYTWVHDWDDEDLLFRASLPGRYGARPRRDGRTILCCEVPTGTDEPAWTEPDATARRVLDEVRRHGIVRGEGELLHHLRLPATYRLPCTGYAAGAEALRESVAAGGPLCLPDEWRFSSSGTIAAIESTLQQAGGI